MQIRLILPMICVTLSTTVFLFEIFRKYKKIIETISGNRSGYSCFKSNRHLFYSLASMI